MYEVVSRDAERPGDLPQVIRTLHPRRTMAQRESSCHGDRTAELRGEHRPPMRFRIGHEVEGEELRAIEGPVEVRLQVVELRFLGDLQEPERSAARATRVSGPRGGGQRFPDVGCMG